MRIIVSILLLLLSAQATLAQIESPDEKVLFREDTKREEDKHDRQLEQALTVDRRKSQDVDFVAPNVEYLKEGQVLKGSGGVLISHAGSQFQSESAEYNVESKEADLFDNVLFSASDGLLSCDSAKFNIEQETGTCDEVDFLFERGSYRIESEHLDKVSEFDYKFGKSISSTCQCSDGTKPWQFNSSRLNVTEEGYAHAYNVTFDVHGVPVFYTPYFFFPVKTERSSGFLIPDVGYSSTDGTQFSIPLFLVLDDYTDITFTPFIESRTRRGTSGEFRRTFSNLGLLDTKFIYSDESPRDGELRGTNVSGLADPTFDDDRFGGFLKYTWKPDPELDLPVSFVADGRYVSDDLFLREMEEEDIGLAQSRFVTSKAIFRADLGDYVSSDLTAEYNQALQTDDDFVFQRLPEAHLNALKSWRAFGTNPYGLKLVTKADAYATAFDRDTGFDGNRYDLYPNVKVPFHFKNYFSTDFIAGYRRTFYDLDETFNPSSKTDLEETETRSIYDFEVKTSTAIERVYQLPKD
ncbi:MAG: LPS-assembly protein LptD, partial [Bdellovibrionales bacterium]|nr:LPS-assembly protein LptD [Bdellovibrionales bacterium]